MTLPPDHLQHLLENAIGKRAKHWTVPDCGLSAALRFSVRLEDNSRVFVKAATDEYTAQWLKDVFRKLIIIDLEWAADCLGLEYPDVK